LDLSYSNLSLDFVLEIFKSLKTFSAVFKPYQVFTWFSNCELGVDWTIFGGVWFGGEWVGFIPV